MAWLLAQLNLDLPKYAEHVAADRFETLAAQAMIPPVLAAAEYVDFVRLDAALIARALDEWRVASSDDENSLAETLLTWWTTYDEGQTTWPVALAALEKMLGGA